MCFTLHAAAQVALFSATANGASPAGDTNAMYSMDGVTWTISPTGMPFALQWQRVVYGNGMFVAIPWGATNVAFSVDGMSWAPSPGGLPWADDWVDMTYGNGMFVTVGYGSSDGAYSYDGSNWFGSTLPSNADWNCVAYGNGVFVAIAAYSSEAAYSGDGIHWTNSPAGMPASAYWQCVTYGNGVFAALVGGTSQAAYSPNGIVWSNATGLPSADWASIDYGDGLFVAVPSWYSSPGAYSRNGITWYTNTMPTTEVWYGSAFANGIFAVIANSTTTATYSTSGTNWTTSTSALPYPDVWYTVAGNPTQTNLYITNGAQAYWRLNDGSGTTATDYMGNVNMPLFGSPSWSSDFLTLNGTSQYGNTGTDSLSSQTSYTDMTICAWIKQAATSASYQSIVDESFYQSSTGYYGGWGLWLQNGALVFSDGKYYTELVDSGPASVYPGEWAFVAVVYHYNYPHVNNFEGDFYIDGFLNSYPITAIRSWRVPPVVSG